MRTSRIRRPRSLHTRAPLPAVRRLSCLITVAVLAVLTACAATPTRDPGEAPRLSGLVFVVYPGAGLAPGLWIARMAPSLLVYGDGTVLRNTAEWGRTATYEVGRSSPEIVAAFIAELAKDPLFTGRADVGMPNVTDQGVTVVRIHGAGGEQEVDAYAFSRDMDRYVSWTQRRHRAALRDIIIRAGQLPGDGVFEPYVPQLVAVTRLGPWPGTSSPSTRPVPAWPGPDLDALLTLANRSGTACGLVTGAAAARLAAAGVANPQGDWTVAGKTTSLAVNTDPEAADWCRPR